MPSIELTEIKAAFGYAAKVYDGEISSKEALARLRDDHGLNVNSARDFINQFRCMLRGEIYKRTLNALALAYFLEQILLTRGQEAAAKAVSATWKHIEYYEALPSQRSRQQKFRTALTQFESGVFGLKSHEGHKDAFASEVVDALRDAPSDRRARLAKASTKPELITTTSVVFKRNPDVVAEVLHRAKGHCELCGNAAPFMRCSDKTPYLEVHHTVQLAHGGDDSVANAIAACPNCHRREHFG